MPVRQLDQKYSITVEAGELIAPGLPTLAAERRSRWQVRRSAVRAQGPPGDRRNRVVSMRPIRGNLVVDPMAAAMEELKDRAPVRLELDPIAAVALVSNVQLALRHPGNNGASAVIIRQVVEGVIGQLAPDEGSILRRVLEMGWRSEFDTPREY